MSKFAIDKMGYKELKELVIKNLKEDPDYLDEQIEILDERNALFQACSIEFPLGEGNTPQILEWLIKIREELNEPAEVQKR